MEFGALVCKSQNPLCKICHLQKYCKFFNSGNYIPFYKKFPIKVKKFNIYCYLNRYKKEIALTKNNNLSFLNNFKMPEIQIEVVNNNLKRKGWNF